MPKVHPLLSLPIAILAWPVQAWALHLAWTWFMIPTGAPDVSAVTLLGAAMAARLALSGQDFNAQIENFDRWKKQEHVNKRAFMQAIYAWVWPLMVVAIGYVIHLFG